MLSWRACAGHAQAQVQNYIQLNAASPEPPPSLAPSESGQAMSLNGLRILSNSSSGNPLAHSLPFRHLLVLPEPQTPPFKCGEHLVE